MKIKSEKLEERSRAQMHVLNLSTCRKRSPRPRTIISFVSFGLCDLPRHFLFRFPLVRPVNRVFCELLFCASVAFVSRAE